MANNAALANAIAALAAAVAAIRPPAAPTKIYDPFASNDPFDLSSRSGSTAYTSCSAPLDQIWDGDVSNFPSFVVVLRLRAKEGKWDAAGDTGILQVDGKDILTEYHSITNQHIEDARIARTNDRALQNSKAMYACIKSSVKGNLKDTIFTQFDNIPDYDDGVALFKKMTTFTTVASLQLSMLSFTNILNFSPSDLHFNIPAINSKLIHLFILSTTSSRKIDDSEQISHTLNAYGKIVQPESWAQWVRNKIDAFEEGTITVSQTFMNAAVMKYNKIICDKGKFSGSITSVQEDIVAMIAKSTKRKRNIDNDDGYKKKQTAITPPPFLTHYKDSKEVKYKLGDTKMHNNKKFYFCDCPDHRNRLKWHTHSTEDCRTRINWLAKGAPAATHSTGATAEANVVADTNVSTDPTSNDASSASTPSVSDTTDTSSITTDPSNLQALLASAMNLVSDNDAVRDMIGEVLNATSEM